MNMLPPKKSFYSIVVKRFLDILLSGIAIIILFPIFFIIGILELIFHGRPIFYHQVRVGKNGKLFNIHKFRSMTNQTDENGNLLPGNQRLTKFGMFIRKTSLDELPELFCIIKGDMSIIGPRPLLPQYTKLYNQKHKRRLLVRPGLTCLWIKKNKDDIKPDKFTWGTQFDNDVWYVDNISFLTDIKMIFAIIKEVISPREDRISAIRQEFNGKNLYDDI